MVRVFALVSTFIVVGMVPQIAKAQDPDPWFGRDKALHFGFSAALASGGYAAGALIWDGPTERLLAGAGLSLSLGVAKEIADMAGAGDPSWRDLAWDVVGTGVGLALAWSVDRLFLQGTPRRAKPAGTSAGLAFHW